MLMGAAGESLSRHLRWYFESPNCPETKAGAACAMGLSRSTVAHWIRGRNTPSLELFREFCIHTGISADWWLDLRDVEGPMDYCLDYITDLERRIAVLEREREALIGQVKAGLP